MLLRLRLRLRRQRRGRGLPVDCGLLLGGWQSCLTRGETEGWSDLACRGSGGLGV